MAKTTNFETISKIDGLTLEPRKIIADERGGVMHMVKASEIEGPIAEVYFSIIKPQVNKGWKRHKRMWQRYAVPVGEIEFKFIDERPGSTTFGSSFSTRVSRENHVLLTVPPGVWYSFQCVSDVEAIIVNAASLEHDSSEIETRSVD